MDSVAGEIRIGYNLNKSLKVTSLAILLGYHHRHHFFS